MEDTRCSAPSDDGGKQFFNNLKDMNEEVVVVLFGIVSWLWFSMVLKISFVVVGFLCSLIIHCK